MLFWLDCAAALIVAIGLLVSLRRSQFGLEFIEVMESGIDLATPEHCDQLLRTASMLFCFALIMPSPSRAQEYFDISGADPIAVYGSATGGVVKLCPTATSMFERGKCWNTHKMIAEDLGPPALTPAQWLQQAGLKGKLLAVGQAYVRRDNSCVGMPGRWSSCSESYGAWREDGTLFLWVAAN